MAYDPTSNPTLISGNVAGHFAPYVLDRVLDEERPYNVCRQAVEIEGHHPASVVQFIIQADPGVGATYTEGTGQANTALTTSQVQATALAYGQMTLVTDEVEEDMVFSALSQWSGVLGRSAAEYVDITIANLLDDFASTYGTAGVATSYADLLAAQNGLAARDQLNGPKLFVLDPAQVGNVQQDLATTGAAWTGSDSSGVPGMFGTQLNGDAGFSVGGTRVVQTTNVPSTGGACLITNAALAAYEPRSQRLEMQRLAEMPGTKIVYSGRFGVIERRDRAGSTILGS